MKRGFMVGKFMPLHNGHKLLLEFGKKFCDEFTILVDNFENPEISLEDRYNIVKNELENFNTKVVAMDKIMPQKPEDDINFWSIWKDGILRNLNHKPDYIIGSEYYIFKLAELLNCQPILIDPERTMIETSGTNIRQNPYSEKNWRFLTNSSKSYYSKKIAIIGNESTGKSTLCKFLKNHYLNQNTSHSEEFARFYLNNLNRDIQYEDIEIIAKGQQSLMDASNNMGAKIIFYDTDIITTKIWSLKLFNKYPAILDKLIKNMKIDHYLLTNFNSDWIQDGIRYFPDIKDREWFQNSFIKELNYYDCNYTLINGINYKEKEDCSIKVLNKILKDVIKDEEL